jgi:hypothetical protein
MKEQLISIINWIKEDWRSHPLRFFVETACWFDSLACALIVNLTVPNLPYILLYPMWIGGTIAYAWCAYSRKSFGMVITFIMLATIDSLGFIKYISQ